MNKAFVRESDSLSDRCPRCGAPGQAVTRTTLDAWLPTDVRGELGDSAYFCPTPQCEVAYFDGLERFIALSALPRPVYPKDPAAPLCACFGVTVEEIEEDADRGDLRRAREILAHANSAEARCAAMAANGQSCSAELQRSFLRRYRQR